MRYLDVNPVPGVNRSGDAGDRSITPPLVGRCRRAARCSPSATETRTR